MSLLCGMVDLSGVGAAGWFALPALIPSEIRFVPAWVATVFGSSSVVVATLMAFLLNLTLPREKEPAAGE